MRVRANRRLMLGLLGGLLAVLLLAPAAFAHGIPIESSDVPVPLSWFYVGASGILVVSFMLLGSLWSRPLLADSHSRELPRWLSRVITGAGMTITLRIAALTMLVMTVTAATFGVTDYTENVAPSAVFLGFWLVLLPASVLVGDAWGRYHPVETMARLGGIEEGERRSLPGGVWWAAAGLFVFAWFELAYPTATRVRLIGVIIAIWLAVTLVGMARSGIATWLHQREPFAVYSRLLATLSVWERNEDTVRIRMPFVGALREPPITGLSLLLAVLIGSVSFDGLSRTGWWSSSVGTATASAQDLGISAGAARVAFATFGLTAMCALAWGACEAACHAAGRIGTLRSTSPDGTTARIADQFAPTLLPIAAAYLVAHYASFVLTQFSGLVQLASDPLGFGWNLLGTADMTGPPPTLEPITVWLIQVGAIAVGHVVALVLAHDRALELAHSRRQAVVSQLPMLALMVLYTVGGLYFLSEGMV